MGKYFTDLSGLDIVFLISAAAGGFLFFIKLILQLIGGDSDSDGDVDADVDHPDAGHADADLSFKVLSIHGITAFFMMFGLVGFALSKESNAGQMTSVAGAFAAGAVSVWIIAKIFNSMRKLQSSGTTDSTSAIGGEGTVYLTIPEGGTGVVHVSFKNRFREYSAVAQDKQEIKTGERVRVVWANGNVLVVEKI